MSNQTEWQAKVNCRLQKAILEMKRSWQQLSAEEESDSFCQQTNRQQRAMNAPWLQSMWNARQNGGCRYVGQ